MYIYIYTDIVILMAHITCQLKKHFVKEQTHFTTHLDKTLNC